LSTCAWPYRPAQIKDGASLTLEASISDRIDGDCVPENWLNCPFHAEYADDCSTIDQNGV